MIIKDKVVVLTGASGGIGQAIAISLHQQAARLVLVGRDKNKLTQLNRLMGDKHHIVVADLSTESGREKLISYCEQLAQVDLLINNAGVSDFSPFESMTDKNISELINLNLVSPMLLTRALLPILARAKQSYILNVGSSFGTIGYPCFSSYCASKFGLKGFSESLKRELQNESTRVLYIAPRATDTPFNSVQVNQLNRLLGNSVDSAEVVAKAVIKQLQKETDRVAIGWPEKIFLKINMLFPSIVDKAIAKQLPQIKRIANNEQASDDDLTSQKSVQPAIKMSQ